METFLYAVFNDSHDSPVDSHASHPLHPPLKSPPTHTHPWNDATQAVEMAKLREGLKRSETAVEELTSRAMLAEGSLEVTQVRQYYDSTLHQILDSSPPSVLHHTYLCQI